MQSIEESLVNDNYSLVGTTVATTLQFEYCHVEVNNKLTVIVSPGRARPLEFKKALNLHK